MIKVANNISNMLRKQSAERMDGTAGSTPIHLSKLPDIAIPDYALYGAGGALGGAALGAVINKLRGGSALKGGLLGGGIGAGLGLGTRGIMDLLAKRENAQKGELYERRENTARIMGFPPSFTMATPPEKEPSNYVVDPERASLAYAEDLAAYRDKREKIMSQAQADLAALEAPDASLYSGR